MHGWRALIVVWFAGALLFAAIGSPSAWAGSIDDGLEGDEPSWSLTNAGSWLRLVSHARSSDEPHRGSRCERVIVAATTAGTVSMETPIGPVAVIDELEASVWVKASRPDVRIALRVVLPDHGSSSSGRPVEVLIAGDATRDVGRWERLTVGAIGRTLERQLPALRLEHGSDLQLTGAVVTAVVLDAAVAPGDHSFSIDDLAVTGLVPVVWRRDPLVLSAAAMTPVSDPPAGLARGVLEVDHRPFFPRAIDWNGESFAFLAELGFNCVRLPAPAAADQMAAARVSGLWIICPPPPIPDVDLREPDQVPMLRNWDRVLAWDLGTGLSEEGVDDLAPFSARDFARTIAGLED
jgi:hypothetical protein